MRLLAVILVIGALRWAVLQQVNEPYKVQQSESGLEIAADPQEAAREIRPRPHLSLQVLECRTEGHAVTFRVRVFNSGAASGVKVWHLFAVSRGRSYEAAVRGTLKGQVVQGSPRAGFISVTVPDGDLGGATWNIGFKDDAGLWNWTQFRQPG